MGSCVKLSQCEHLDWMMRNKHNIPGVTSSEVAQHLNSLNCGFQGGEPKVNCNDVEDPAPVDVAVTQTAVATRSRSRTRARGGFSRNLNVQSSSCRGSLLAYYLPATRQGNGLSEELWWDCKTMAIAAGLPTLAWVSTEPDRC